MSSQHPHRPELGGRIGPRIADLVTRAMAVHLYKSKDVRAQIHRAGLDAFWQQVGREYKGTLGPHLERWAEHDQMPEELAPLFRFLAAQPGEGAAMLGTLYYGTGLGQTVGAVLSNWLAPIVHGDLAAAPHALLPPDLAAQLVVKGIAGHEQAAGEAQGQAIAGWRFDQMVENATTYPDPVMAFDLYRRGHYDAGELYKAIRRAGYTDADAAKVEQLAFVPLQAADLAEMTLRGIIGQDEGRAKARLVGVPPADFDLLTLMSGEPPGPEQLVEALRRGFIDRARFVKGIRQSRVRDEWIDVEEKLGYSPMDTAQAVDAVVQGHLTDQQGKAVAHLNGLEEQYWPVLVQTAGEPIARGEAIQLLRRGKMTREQVVQAIRESRMKNKYIPDVLDLELRLPPERSVVMMLAHGAITREHALTLLMQDGFDRVTAEALVKAGTAQRTTGARHLAAGTIAELAADSAITQDEALRMLEALGWPAHDAQLELHVAELRREHTFRQQAANRIGTDYVDRLIDRASTITYLDQIGLPPAQRDALLTLWDLERQARRRRLTEAQVHAAAKRGVITTADAHARLVEMGYDETDAHILLSDVGG